MLHAVSLARLAVPLVLPPDIYRYTSIYRLPTYRTVICLLSMILPQKERI